MNSSNIIIIMLAVALILLAAGLVLYPALTVTLNGLLTTTVASVAASTKNPCPGKMENFDGVCFQIVKAGASPVKESCYSTDKSDPISMLAMVNNASAIMRIQKYIDSKNVPGKYYVNLLLDGNTLSTSNGQAFTALTPAEKTDLAPYFDAGKFTGPLNSAQMSYNGGQTITPFAATMSDFLLCQKLP